MIFMSHLALEFAGVGPDHAGKAAIPLLGIGGGREQGCCTVKDTVQHEDSSMLSAGVAWLRVSGLLHMAVVVPAEGVAYQQLWCELQIHTLGQRAYQCCYHSLAGS